MKLLAPFSTQPSPSRTAVVRIAAASLPEPGLGQAPGRELARPPASGTT